MSEEIHKVSLLIRNDDRTRFLACAKRKGSDTSQLIMPGGKIEPGETEEACAQREIGEELGCTIRPGSLKFISRYETEAAGREGVTLYSRLYLAELEGEPRPQREIARLEWLGAADRSNPAVTSTIREHILPDILKRGLIEA